MNKYIESFINRNYNNLDFRNYLNNLLSPLLKDYYYKNDRKKYFSLIVWQESQNKLHNLMRTEVDNIFSYANKHKIMIIGLKGLFFEKQFWNSNCRFYNDVDLLINPNDIDMIYKYFKNDNTYEVAANIKRRKSKKRKLNKMLKFNFKRNHHFVLQKEHNESNLGTKYIQIELHGSLNPLKICNIDDKQLFDNKLTYDNYSVLSVEDQFIFCCYHTIQHLPYVCHDIHEKFPVELEKFYDLYCLIEKGNISWDLLINKISKYCAAPVCSLYLKMFNDIFYDSIPNEITNKINIMAIESDFYWKKIYLRVMKIKPSKLIIGDYKDYRLLFYSFKKILNLFNRHSQNAITNKLYMESWKFILSFINRVS